MKKILWISIIVIALVALGFLGYNPIKKIHTLGITNNTGKEQDITEKQKNEQNNSSPVIYKPEDVTQNNLNITKSPVNSGSETILLPEDFNLYGNNISNLIAGGIACKTENGVVIACSGESGEGTQLKLIDEKGDLTLLGNFSAQYINTDGTFLYFCSMEGGVWGGGIHKLNIADKTDEIIFDGSAKHLVLYGDYLYFCDNTIGYSGLLTKMRKDGTEKTVMTNLKCSYINIVDNWIYYIASNADDEEIRRISIDGAINEILQDNMELPRCLNYCNEYLYWLDFDENIMRVKVDGSEKEVYISDVVDAFVIQNGFLYYLVTDDGFDTIIHQRDLTDNSETQNRILEYTQEEISLIDNWLYMYFTYPDSVLSYAGRYNIATQEYENIDKKTNPY